MLWKRSEASVPVVNLADPSCAKIDFHRLMATKIRLVVAAAWRYENYEIAANVEDEPCIVRECKAEKEGP